MPDTGPRPTEETVRIPPDPSLADELLDSDSGPGSVDPLAADDATAATAGLEDDEEFQPHTQRRSRVTTGLFVALIFALGLLSGVLIGRVLTPDPPPQVVYLLNDATPGSTGPSPSHSR